MRPHQFTVPAERLPPGAIGHNRSVDRQNDAFMPPEGVLVSFSDAACLLYKNVNSDVAL
jgi:hypothetical protein